MRSQRYLEVEIREIRKELNDIRYSLHVRFRNGEFAVYAGDTRISEWAPVPDE